jgi:hypothetical protein
LRYVNVDASLISAMFEADAVCPFNRCRVVRPETMTLEMLAALDAPALI